MQKMKHPELALVKEFRCEVCEAHSDFPTVRIIAEVAMSRGCVFEVKSDAIKRDIEKSVKQSVVYVEDVPCE